MRIQDFKKFIDHGSELRRTIPARVEKAEKANWDKSLVEPIRNEVAHYLRAVSNYSRWFGAFVFLPLLAVVASVLVSGGESRLALNVMVWWMLFWCFAGVIVFAPLAAIIPAVRRIPGDKRYFDLLRIFWLNIDLFVVSVNATLLCYVLFSWSFEAAAPVVVIATGVWLFGPWIAYLVKWELVYAWVRAGQIIVLLFAAGLIVASPVPMGHYQSWAKRRSAEKLRPEGQREITANWESLQWFSQEGTPLVWYSKSPAGYRLFAAPGFDPQTNERLQAVSDRADRDNIVAAFRANAEEAALARRAVEERAALEATERALQKKSTDEEAQRLAAVAAHDALISKYTYRPASGPPGLVLIALRDRSEDVAISGRLSEVLHSASVESHTAVFTPEFISSDIFADMRQGRWRDGRDFNTAEFASAILVIELTERTAPQEPADGVSMIRCEMHGLVRLFSISTFREELSVAIDARGTGFEDVAARNMTIDRLTEEFVKHVAQITAKVENLR